MTKYDDGLGAVASALAHTGRRQIIDRLSSGTATSSELAGELGITLPSMQQHLTVLRGAEVIASRKAGRVVSHRLRQEPLERFDSWLALRTSFWTHQLDALTDHVERR